MRDCGLHELSTRSDSCSLPARYRYTARFFSDVVYRYTGTSEASSPGILQSDSLAGRALPFLSSAASAPKITVGVNIENRIRQ